MNKRLDAENRQFRSHAEKYTSESSRLCTYNILARPLSVNSVFHFDRIKKTGMFESRNSSTTSKPSGTVDCRRKARYRLWVAV